MPQNKVCKCLSSDLIELMTKIIEQNNTLIEQSAAKDNLIMQLIEQNDAILNELVEQDDDESCGSPFIDG
jgi:hypothetical protein